MENVSERKRVDPRVKRTRQWLRQALLDLMAEKSFEAITVQDIAERATINRATFYAHFNEKYALLEYTMRTLFQEKLRAELPEGAPFTHENLQRLIRLVAENLAEVQGHCPSPRGQMDTLMEKQVKAELHEMLRGWLAERPTGKTAGQPRLEQAATIASWAIYGAAVHWSQRERREPPNEFAQQVLPLILASLQPVAWVAAPGTPTAARGRNRSIP